MQVIRVSLAYFIAKGVRRGDKRRRHRQCPNYCRTRQVIEISLLRPCDEYIRVPDDRKSHREY